MSKKADLSIQTIVVAILALIVLVVLVVIFRNQTNKAAGGFDYAGNDALGGIKGTKCQTMLGDRVCGNPNSRYPVENYTYTGPLPKPCLDNPVPKDGSECKNKGWTDCGSNECYEVTKK